MPAQEQTAMQKLIAQIKGAIEIIDRNGKLNDFAQQRKEVYVSVLDVATELLEVEKNREDAAYCKGFADAMNDNFMGA
jgi:hypothetical protein